MPVPISAIPSATVGPMPSRALIRCDRIDVTAMSRAIGTYAAPASVGGEGQHVLQPEGAEEVDAEHAERPDAHGEQAAAERPGPEQRQVDPRLRGPRLDEQERQRRREGETEGGQDLR